MQSGIVSEYANLCGRQSDSNPELSHIDSKDEEILSIMIDEIGFALENVMLLSEIEQHLTNLHDEPTVELTTGNDQLEREIV